MTSLQICVYYTLVRTGSVCTTGITVVQFILHFKLLSRSNSMSLLILYFTLLDY